MKHIETKSMDELLAAANPSRPQAIAAGWFTDQMQPIGAAFVNCKKRPTTGELAVAWATCLAGCLKRIEELTANDPAMLDAIWNIVSATTGSLEVVARLKNEFAAIPLAKAGVQ